MAAPLQLKQLIVAAAVVREKVLLVGLVVEAQKKETVYLALRILDLMMVEGLYL